MTRTLALAAALALTAATALFAGPADAAGRSSVTPGPSTRVAHLYDRSMTGAGFVGPHTGGRPDYGFRCRSCFSWR